MKNKIALNSFMFNHLPLNEVLSYSKEYGYTGIGLCIDHVKCEDMNTLKDKLNTYNLKPISLYVIFLNVDKSEINQSEREFIRNAIKLCEKSGIPSLTIIPQASFYTSKSIWISNFVKICDELCGLLKQSNVKILFEPLHPVCRNVSCLCDLNDAIALNSIIDNKKFSWVLDFYHIGWNGNINMLSEEFIQNVYTIHLSDWPKDNSIDIRYLPGEGILPLKQMIYDCKSKGYNGWWEMEILSPDMKLIQPREILNKINSCENILEL